MDEKTRTQCPSCHSPSSPNEISCEKCGVIFSKWKDPAQRAAEARLAALGESNHKIPSGLIFGLSIVLAVPLMVLCVPDVGVPLMGAKMRYDVSEKWQANYVGESHLVLEQGSQLLDEIRLEANVHFKCVESDSGGNITLVQNFSDAKAASQPKDVGSWQSRFLVSSRGYPISTMAMAQDAIQQNFSTTKHLQNMKMEHAKRMTEEMDQGRDLSLPQQTMAPDPLQNFVVNLDPRAYKHLALATVFQWPKERIRPGASWTQPFFIKIAAPEYSLDLDMNIPFQVLRTKRTTSGYAVVLSWNTPISFSVPNRGHFQGTYQGEATVGFADGVLNRWNGQLSTSNESSEGGPIQLKLNHSVTRL